MESKDVPQWVSQSFVRSLVNAGATASREEILACCGDLIYAWCAPDRFEHGFQHLLDMLSRVDSLAPETPNPDLVRIATWFHGIVFSTADLEVYTRNGGEDEHASARIAEEKLAELGLSPETIKVVKKLIVGLKRRTLEHIDTGILQRIGETAINRDTGSILLSETGKFEPIDMNQHALCDAHLGALAVEPQRYRKYSLRIREEYAHIPLTHFLAARIKIVQRLLARKKLFISPLATSWESIARQNLTVELESLIAELAKARESDSSASSAANKGEAGNQEEAGEKNETTQASQEIHFADALSVNSENTSLQPNPPAATLENSANEAKSVSEHFSSDLADPDHSTVQSTNDDGEKIGSGKLAENSLSPLHLEIDDQAKAQSEKISSPTSEFEMVQSLNGDTVVRKAPQVSLSSLEMIDEDFDPKRSPKVIRPKAKPEPANQDEPEQDAQEFAAIKHGIEAAPDF